MKGDFEFLCHQAAVESAAETESEIEAILLSVFRLCGKVSALKVVISDLPSTEENWHFLVTPQFQWQGYRIDFCLRTKDGQVVFIECDGHDFHERTKEQAERDRSRDRAIQAAGIPILRFTGREIWRDAADVFGEIMSFLADRRASKA